MSKNVYIGGQPFKKLDTETKGEFCQIDGKSYYKLSNVDQMRPFFISLVSSEDHWLFVTSNKGITAGRVNSDLSLFPYYTEDKLMASVDDTGSKTILLVEDSGKALLWEPYSNRYRGIYAIERNLYKNRNGSQIIFEEVNHDLQLAFRECWAFSNRFGIVKTSELQNLAGEDKEVQILDGLQDIIPTEVSEHLQAIRSNLADAYKKIELHNELLGIYSLSARIVDRAIPSEALYSTIAWSTGLPIENILLSSKQLDKFRMGKSLEFERDVRAEKGAYFISSTVKLGVQESKKWHIVAEVEQSISDIVAMSDMLEKAADLFNEVEEDVQKNTRELMEKIARADGIQFTGDSLVTTRHLNNVMFNIMRGGIFMEDYQVDKADFKAYLLQANKILAKGALTFLKNLPDQVDIIEMRKMVVDTGDLDLQRLVCEYLPLSFSRRHGDPSRPWNKFNIIVRDDDDNDLKYYEGNWRDIFQNWEALAISFPEYIENMILRFLNASTIDGYNPYRISSEGIDWEVSDPDDPWSYIGYWGDHQLIYLLKLLEMYEQVKPGMLSILLGHNYGVYANVPYRIKPFDEILANPQDTITYDAALANTIDKRIAEIGSDGKLVVAQDGNLLRSTVIEKILISVLTKVSNFIPDGGIWMNTQRPEWNDANNALVGNGISMVTLYQLRRYLLFLDKLLKAETRSDFEVNEVISGFLYALKQIFDDYGNLATEPVTPAQRYEVMTKLGEAGESYRGKAYTAFADTNIVSLPVTDLLAFINQTIAILDQTIHANKRQDGLYHSYNILNCVGKEAHVGRLDLMLEGQVNVVASGYLSAGETLDLLKSLSSSALYRADQNSYILYPNKQRALFVNRNNIPAELLQSSKLISVLKENGNNDIIQFDKTGVAHFHPDFHNAEALGQALDGLAQVEEYTALVNAERKNLLDIYEKVFTHKEFTGRSGTFYGYEGLGSIYWHMVSKLVESVSEVVEASAKLGDQLLYQELVANYERLKDGIGVHKSPKEYGAIPTDPYSHTPGNKGVQQPGMTGQVKEDILSRFRELGVNIVGGQIIFNRGFFNKHEFLAEGREVDYLDLREGWQKATVNKVGIFYTVCQVPIIYEKASYENLEITYRNGEKVEIDGNTLPADISNEVFARTGKVRRITYRLPF